MLEVTLPAAFYEMHTALTNPEINGNFNALNANDIEHLFYVPPLLVVIKAKFPISSHLHQKEHDKLGSTYAFSFATRIYSSFRG
jgi:hypothetical protein